VVPWMSRTATEGAPRVAPLHPTATKASCLVADPVRAWSSKIKVVRSSQLYRAPLPTSGECSPSGGGAQSAEFEVKLVPGSGFQPALHERPSHFWQKPPVGRLSPECIF
jgi:hypothetical protein